MQSNMDSRIMRMWIPTKVIKKHMKHLAALLVIIYLFCSMRNSYCDNITVPIEENPPEEASSVKIMNASEILRLKEERSLPHNVIPDIHSLLRIDILYKALSYNNKECTFPTNKSPKAYDFIADVTESDFQETEKSVFKNHRWIARQLTHKANTRLKQILEVNSGNDFYTQDNSLVVVSDEQTGMGMKFGSYLFLPGGHWIPLNCTPKWKVAVIIPYRNRMHSLNVLLRNLVPFLRNQELEFGIFLAEQGSSEQMNRGLMKNIGFQMAQLSGTKWDCYVFHDVDYIPMNVSNYYGCDDHPKHYATRLEEFKYDNPYLTDFGGVVGLTGKQFDELNGYSNMYWGWGGEDSDLYKRVHFNNLNITHSREGYYRDLPHKKKTLKDKSLHRACLFRKALRRMKLDGLSRIRYDNFANISLSTLYTIISVDVIKSDWNHNFPICRVFFGERNNNVVAVKYILILTCVMLLIFSCAITLALRDMDNVEENHEKLYGGRKKEEEEEIEARRCVEWQYMANDLPQSLKT